MRACAFTSLFGGTVLAVLFALVGCGGGASAPPAASPAPETTPSSEPTPAAPADEAAAAPASSSANAPAGSADAPAGDAPDSEGAGGTETRTSEIIAETVKAHRKEARECYQKQLSQLPDLKGDLVVHFTLRPNGTVKMAELNRERSTITAPVVVNCVLDVVRAIKFPRSSRGMETTVNYPFNFNPS
jgi:outer membrane biosynthesis protein TonB